MTKENQKLLYDHYVKTNQLVRADEILKSFPEFKIKEIKKERVKNDLHK